MSSPSHSHTLKPPSKCFPTKSKGNYIETFFSLKAEEFRSINKTGKPKHNISYEQHLAIRNLMDNPSIIIKNADKGGRVVVLDRDDHLREANTILSDTDYYNSEFRPHTFIF